MSYDFQNATAVLSRAGGATANLSGVAATAAKTYTTQNITFANQGKLYYAATASGATTPTVDLNTAVAFKPLQKNQGCVYVWGYNTANSNAVVLLQGSLPVTLPSGSIQTNVDNSGNFSPVPQFPAIPDAVTPFAYSVVYCMSTYAGTGFIPGSSDNWNATGVVTTQQDVFAMPATPQTA